MPPTAHTDPTNLLAAAGLPKPTPAFLSAPAPKKNADGTKPANGAAWLKIYKKSWPMTLPAPATAATLLMKKVKPIMLNPAK